MVVLGPAVQVASHGAESMHPIHLGLIGRLLKMLEVIELMLLRS